ncbi:MAG: CHASE2 domain-containing protein [Pseudomonadota bacterium]
MLPLDLVATAGCVVFVGLLVISGVIQQANNFLLEMRFGWLSETMETDTVIVEIDTKSLQAMPDWPWDRSVHGRMVDVLDAHGAAAIAFDVDFSAVGAAKGDAAFGEAIARARAPVWLAAHRQPLSRDLPDILAETLPNPVVGAAASLAAVTYPIDFDGVVRRGERQMTFSFGTLPSIAVALAGRAPQKDTYFVDFSLDTRSFGRASYADVLAGDVPDTFFAGKTVFVGATALELGDEYVMPTHGMQSGVVLNALAYETLKRDAALQPVGGVYVYLVVAILCFLLCRERMRRMGVVYVAVHVAVVATSVFLPLIAQASAHIIIPLAALHAGQGAVLVYAVARDLERRSLAAFKAHVIARNSSALLETLISENNDGFVVVNQSGVIELFNDRAKALLLVNGEELKGTNLTTVAPVLADRLDFNDSRLGLIERFEMSIEGDEKNIASQRALDVAVNRSIIAPMDSRFERRTDPRSFIAITLHDISAQKRAEIAERTAKESHAEMSAAKTQLISNMSHELRTPLNSVIGFSDVLSKEMYGPLGSDEYKGYAEQINASGRGLLSLVNDMMFATKLQAGELEVDPYKEEPAELIEEALNAAKQKVSWSDQRVEITNAAADAMIRVDAQTFKTALTHLIDNAAKFGGPDGRIDISVERLNDRIAISVSDEGPGCEPDLLPKLTGLFYQGDGDRSRNFEGAGLGLFVAEKIALLHGATLNLSSTPGAGFTAMIAFEEARAKKVDAAA